MNIKELENVITQLSEEDFRELMCRLDEYRNELWDKQIAEDFDAGRLDHLIAQAKEEVAAGFYRKL